MDHVGVIGLGKMGLPIARNLMARGFRVTGYRRSGSPELAKQGGVTAASPAEVAAQTDVLLSIVPGAEDVEEIICGPAGTLTALRPGTIHIEMSTIDVDRKARLRDQVRAKGGDLLDCPISGSPGMVAPRLATTFASGDQGSVETVSQVLDAISGPWVYTGAFGAGWRPFFFLKAPTTSVMGSRDPIVISSAARARYDWEAELAVIIGVKGKNIDAERAGFHVAAYCACNDRAAPPPSRSTPTR